MSNETCDRCGNPRDSRMSVDSEGAPHMRRVCCASLFSLDADHLGRMLAVAREQLQLSDSTDIASLGHTWAISEQVYIQVKIVEDGEQVDTFWFSFNSDGEFTSRSSREMRIAELKAELQ